MVTCCSLTACSLPSEERRLAAPYLLRRLAAPYLMRRLALTYLMRRHYSLVIASRPEVAFITLAIPVCFSAAAINHVASMRYHGASSAASSCGGFHPGGFSLGVRLLVRQRVSSGGARLELLVGLDQRLCFISDSLDQKWFRSEVVFHSGYSRPFYLIFLMAKKDMHTYVSQLKDTELETLIATYDIPLDLRPRLPDPNFRMINLPAGDTAIEYEHRAYCYLILSISNILKQGDWFSFAKCGDPAHVCMEGVKSGLKLWKEKYFLIDRRAISFHMPWRHPDSCITDRVPTSFNQNHVDRLKSHVVKLCDIPEGVLVRSGVSRVWRNPMCDSVLRFLSIHDFCCMPSLDKVTVREEPHGLDTSILDRVADRTTSPALAGTTIPRASLEEIAITWPDGKVVTKADNAAKRKASIGSEISTNATKKTQSSKKGSGAGSSGQAAGDGVEQADDGTLDDDDQRDYPEFATEDIKSLNDANQGEHKNIIPLRTSDSSIGLDVIYPPILLPDKEVEPYGELSGGVRRTTRTGFCVSHGKIVSLLTSASDYTKFLP
ncbi:hypothetical protein Tco_0286184, partial [Tanacetum coccineum]